MSVTIRLIPSLGLNYKMLSGHGSPFIKLLQIIALIIAGFVLLLLSIKAHAHVDLHFHSIEYDYIRERKDQEAREKRDLENEIKQTFPDSSKEERREIYKVEKDIKDTA
jgi:hypothetical protein